MKPIVRKKIQAKPQFLKSYPGVVAPAPFMIQRIRSTRIVVREKVVRRGTLVFFKAPPIPIPIFQSFIRQTKIWPRRKRIRQAAVGPIYPRFFNTGLGPVISAVYDFIISARRRRGR